VNKSIAVAFALALLAAAACASKPDPKLVPALNTPADGDIVDNGCTTEENAIVWDFDWTDVPGATSYELWVKHKDSAQPDIHETVQSSSYRVGRIATMEGKFLQDWEWKVRATVNGVEEPWSATAKFAVEPPDTDCQ
jgi:hypothetical protein